VTTDSAETSPVTNTLDIPIAQSPALTITKTITSGATFAAVGDVISYEYRVVNSGNVTVDGPITVTDDRTGVTCPATSSLGPGASMTCTADYLVTLDDLDAGSVTNTAIATGLVGSVQLASTTVSAIARSAVSPTAPPSNALEEPGDAAGSASVVAALLLLLLALMTMAFLVVPTRARRRPPR
jgi:large repetitive protein